MKKVTNFLLLSILGCFLMAGNAMAVPVLGGDLQNIFDDKGWGLDAQNDQMLMPDAWILTNASGASSMVFYYENPEGMEFGIYSTAGLEEATVFDGTNTPIAKAVVSFDSILGAVVMNYYDAGGYLIPASYVSAAFTGETFGFWIGDGTNKFYSDADMNDVNNNGTFGEEEDVALLAYMADPGSYVFAGDIDGSKSFANVVTQAESIKPIPEPATMVLLGIGLLGLAGISRKKIS